MVSNDLLRVILLKDGNEPEALPVSFVEDMGEYSIGILEMEPGQDFGYHKGDKIGYFPYTDKDGTTILICDMNPSRRLTKEDLKDGTMLKGAIAVLNKQRNRENLIEIIELLRDSYVWIPCNAVMSEKDQKRLEEHVRACDDDMEKIVGLKFIAEDETRLIPDILQNGNDFFFPVFSSEEEMGEYGTHFSKICKHFLEALVLAKNNERELSGVVVNAFSESFVLDRGLWDMVEQLNSRVGE